MPIGKYRGITLQRELVDVIEHYIKSHKEMGYKSLADFITDAIREKCEQLKILTPMPEQPILEHFNLSEEGVRVLDRSLANHTSRGRIIDVFFKEGKIWCDYCESADCRHVKFALSLPVVHKIISKKGWYIPER